MGLNVSTNFTFELEGRELLKNTAKNILASGGTSSQSVEKVVTQAFQKTDSLFNEIYLNPQLSVLKASEQITLNNSLKETIKYLKAHANDKRKKAPIFGEIWNEFTISNNASEDNSYKGELFEFTIDKNAKNIFAA